MTCTFFGHRDAPMDLAKALKDKLKLLIEEKGVNSFYVGNNGGFDFAVIKVLKLLKVTYPHISFSIILAYMPTKSVPILCGCDTLYPENLIGSMPRFAIIKRNKWMLDKSDYVVVFVQNNFGGAASFKALAEKQGKIVYNIADDYAKNKR